jgi:hypothetical protein
MTSSGLPCPADTGYAGPRSRGGWNCCYQNRTGRRAAHSVFLSAASVPQQPDHRGGVVDGTNGAVLGHFAQTALKNYNRATDLRRRDARISAEEDAMRQSIGSASKISRDRGW